MARKGIEEVKKERAEGHRRDEGQVCLEAKEARHGGGGGYAGGPEYGSLPFSLPLPSRFAFKSSAGKTSRRERGEREEEGGRERKGKGKGKKREREGKKKERE